MFHFQSSSLSFCLGKAEDGPLKWETQEKFLALAWRSPGLCGRLRGKPADKRNSVSPFLCNCDFKIIYWRNCFLKAITHLHNIVCSSLVKYFQRQVCISHIRESYPPINASYGENQSGHTSFNVNITIASGIIMSLICLFYDFLACTLLLISIVKFVIKIITN